MKKIIILLLGILCLCAINNLQVHANEMNYIVDEGNHIVQKDEERLNARAQYINDHYDLAFYFAYVEEDVILSEYAKNLYQQNAFQSDGCLLVMNENEWYVYRSGRMITLFDGDDTIQHSSAGYDISDSDDLTKIVDQYFNYIEDALNENNIVHKRLTIPKKRLLPRVVDEADILSDEEEQELEAIYDEISEKNKLDVALVTINDSDGKLMQDYADDYYDYNGFGFGTNKDGTLLVVNMENRKWHITTTGYGITVITDAGLEYMSEQFLPYLSDGNYYQSFLEYVNQVDAFVQQAKTGQPYDSGNLPKEPFNILIALAISVVIGLIISLIIVCIMRCKHKTIRYQSKADEYMKKDSFELKFSKDLFLYRNMIRTRKPESDSSSGSSTHSSSSGSSHGGGGGSF